MHQIAERETEELMIEEKIKILKLRSGLPPEPDEDFVTYPTEEIHPRILGEGVVMEKMLWRTGLKFSEYKKCVEKNGLEDFKTVIIPQSNFLMKEESRHFPEDVKPWTIIRKSESLTFSEFIQFSLFSTKIRRDSVYVPIGTNVKADFFIDMPHFPVISFENFSNGNFWRVLTSKEKPILQCGICPSAQFSKRRIFYLLKIK